jgi:hypothetical protein
MAWERVAGNKGSRSAGVDGMTTVFVRERIGLELFLESSREQLKVGARAGSGARLLCCCRATIDRGWSRSWPGPRA